MARMGADFLATDGRIITDKTGFIRAHPRNLRLRHPWFLSVFIGVIRGERSVVWN
jgi:hypothetical protein